MWKGGVSGGGGVRLLDSGGLSIRYRGEDKKNYQTKPNVKLAYKSIFVRLI